MAHPSGDTSPEDCGRFKPETARTSPVRNRLLEPDVMDRGRSLELSDLVDDFCDEFGEHYGAAFSSVRCWRRRQLEPLTLCLRATRWRLSAVLGLGEFLVPADSEWEGR